MIAPAIAQKFAFEEFDLVRSITSECYFDFLQEFWGTIVPEKPVFNWHIEYLCEEFQTVMERVFEGKPKLYDVVINIPPGTTKSTVFSIASTAWCWTRMPSLRSINASHTFPLGLDLSRKSRDLIRSEKYQSAFPHVHIHDDQDTKGYYATTAGGMRMVSTVGGGAPPTGFHAHLHIVDDPIDPTAPYSEATMKAANNWMTEVLPSRKVDKAITPLFLVMQRISKNDPSGKILERYTDKRRIKHICLPAELSNNVNPPHLAKRYVRGLLDPVRLSPAVLEEARLNGAFTWEGQYQQNPITLGKPIFKVEKFNQDEIPPPRHFFKVVWRYWDKAATKDGGKRTAGVLMGVDHKDRIWVLDVQKGQWATEERENVIDQIALTDGKKVKIATEQEPGSGGKDSALATQRRLLRKGYVCVVDLVGQAEGNKINRAQPYSHYVNSGWVYLPKDAPWIAEYKEELQWFPGWDFADQVDASSGAFNIITGRSKSVGAL
jgi:predicted phage terminase large subunit-like protein